MKGIKIYSVDVEAFDNVKDEGRIYIDWTGNIGWGQCILSEDKTTGKWICDSENMGKEFVIELFKNFINSDKIIIK